jgi:hypothetical protein
MIGDERVVDLGRLWLRPDGILHVVLDFTGPPTAAAADEFLAARASLVGDRRVPVILELRRVPYVTRWIRLRFMRRLQPGACRAVVTTSSTCGAFFRTYELLSPSPVPSRTFLTVEEAEAWIATEFGDHID